MTDTDVTLLSCCNLIVTSVGWNMNICASFESKRLAATGLIFIRCRLHRGLVTAVQNQKHLKRPFCTSVLRALTGQIQCFRAYANAVYPNRLCSIKNCVIEQACSVYMFKDSTASVWPRCVWLLHRFRIMKCIIFSAETRKETRFGKLFSLRFCIFYSLLNIRCSFIQQQGTIIIVRYGQLSLSSAFSA